MPPSQPWWTSKGFWTSLVTIALALLVKFGVIPATEDTILWSTMILGLLQAIFRWTADQPLTVSGGENLKKGASGLKRMTHD